MADVRNMIKCIKVFFLKDENGQVLVEYGLILALIFLVVLGTVVIVGEQIVDIYRVRIVPFLPWGS